MGTIIGEGITFDDVLLDDVPKTGSHSPVLWLVCIAAASGAVSYGLRRTKQSSK